MFVLLERLRIVHYVEQIYEEKSEKNDQNQNPGQDTCGGKRKKSQFFVANSRSPVDSHVRSRAHSLTHIYINSRVDKLHSIYVDIHSHKHICICRISPLSSCYLSFLSSVYT